MVGSLPLLFEMTEAVTIAFYKGRLIDRKTFLFHVEQVCKTLPQHKYSINICDNRYHFLVAFAASIVNSQISLLPSSSAPKEIQRLGELYKDNYIIADKDIENICVQGVNEQYQPEETINIKSDQIVSVVFTSGSTGIPKANTKTWRQLFESAKRVKERFSINNGQQHSVIATVPPQHMFGFETTIIYPLMLGVAIHSERPFYPLDVQQALLEMPSPHILITTPLHLNVCSIEENKWPDIDFIISATAPMSNEVAKSAEISLNTKVFEIYGCSEAGAIATRQTSANEDWYLLTNYRMSVVDGITTLDAPGYNEHINIPDHVEINDCYFKLVGRNSDIVKIGGKRASLGDLTKILKSISGVDDAVVIMPDEIEGRRTRLAAFVVSNTEEKEIRQEYSKFVDRVFLPRPVIFVKELPYNELGKLPRIILLELLSQHIKNYDYRDIA